MENSPFKDGQTQSDLVYVTPQVELQGVPHTVNPANPKQMIQAAVQG